MCVFFVQGKFRMESYCDCPAKEFLDLWILLGSPKTNDVTQKLMVSTVSRWSSSSNGTFSGSTLVFAGVDVFTNNWPLALEKYEKFPSWKDYWWNMTVNALQFWSYIRSPVWDLKLLTILESFNHPAFWGLYNHIGSPYTAALSCLLLVSILQSLTSPLETTLYIYFHVSLQSTSWSH